MNIRFITKNKHKIKEITSLLENTGVSIIAAEYSIDEIQTENVEALIRDKLLKAFNLVGRPVFVEHYTLKPAMAGKPTKGISRSINAPVALLKVRVGGMFTQLFVSYFMRLSR